jgi:hypothetical protein
VKQAGAAVHSSEKGLTLTPESSGKPRPARLVMKREELGVERIYQ